MEGLSPSLSEAMQVEGSMSATRDTSQRSKTTVATDLGAGQNETTRPQVSVLGSIYPGLIWGTYF